MVYLIGRQTPSKNQSETDPCRATSENEFFWVESPSYPAGGRLVKYEFIFYRRDSQLSDPFSTPMALKTCLG